MRLIPREVKARGNHITGGGGKRKQIEGKKLRVKEHGDLKGEAIYKKKGGDWWERSGRPRELFDLEKQKMVSTNF